MEPGIKAGATVAGDSTIRTKDGGAIRTQDIAKMGATVAMICCRNVHCSGTRHSGSVAHTVEDD